MVRLACVNIQALPLQVLLRRHPDWKSLPVAVVQEEAPQARILWVNRLAAQYRIRPGLRNTEGLGLCPELRSGAVTAQALEKAVASILPSLFRFSPHVEPSLDVPGVFWLNCQGLGLIAPDPGQWVENLRAALEAQQFKASIVAGFNRFFSHAVTRTLHGVRVFKDPAAEQCAALKVPLEKLVPEPLLRESLHQLGLESLADFVRMPQAGILKRFGAPALHLHTLASGALRESLQPVPEPIELMEGLDWEHPIVHKAKLLGLLEAPLGRLRDRAGARRCALKSLLLTLKTGGNGSFSAGVEPAVPTGDLTLILNLFDLRLEGLNLREGILGLTLNASTALRESEQLNLFSRQGETASFRDNTRDNKAGERALAQAAALLGEQALCFAEPAGKHLPEASVNWVPAKRLNPPKPLPPRVGPSLVRRIQSHPKPMAMKMAPPEAGAGLARLGPFGRLRGAYSINGAWWAGGVQRDYFFTQNQHNELNWMYFNWKTQRWYRQGSVE